MGNFFIDINYLVKKLLQIFCCEKIFHFLNKLKYSDTKYFFFIQMPQKNKNIFLKNLFLIKLKKLFLIINKI